MKQIRALLRFLFPLWSIRLWLWWQKVKRREIRFPAGSSRDGMQAVLGAFYREGKFGTEILVCSYEPNKNEEEKEEMLLAEDPKSILEREMLEKTGIRPIGYSLIGHKNVPNTNLERRGSHRKHGFAIYIFDDSNMRTKFPKSWKIKDIRWIPIGYLQKVLWPHHWWLLVALGDKPKYEQFDIPNKGKIKIVTSKNRTFSV